MASEAPPRGVLGRIAPGGAAHPARAPVSSVDVLLVHCEAGFATSVADALRRHAFTAVAPAGAEEALELVRAGCTPRLVVVDLDEGAGAAAATVRRMRDEPACAGTGFLGLTRSRGADANSLGVTDLVLRPVELAELLAAVSRHCGRP